MLWLFSRPTWPAVDSARERAVRADLDAVLFGAREPDPRTATLIALLLASDSLTKVVSHEGVSSRDLKRRAAQIADGGWAPQAVKRAIADAQAAVTAATVSATAATIAST